jgi:parallel beta-helix repeat protein
VVSNRNNLTDNHIYSNKNYGLYLYFSRDNHIYHNNITNNTNQVFDHSGLFNYWDNGYPDGGNYWSDYDGVDLNGTADQNIPPPDGIGDTPYIIDSDSQDNYPLILPFGKWQPPKDTTPPVISSVSVTGISNNTATITWMTDEPCTSSLNWSINSDLSDNSTTNISGLTTFHTITLSSLESNQTYYFEVKSKDFYANSATDNNNSHYYRFTTLSFDIQKPSISSIVINPPIQEINGYVNITTTISDDSEVGGAWINITDPLGEIIGNFSMTFDPSSGKYYFDNTYSITGNYYFIIWAVDMSNNSASQTGNFEIIETPPVQIDTTPPTITNAMAGPSPQELEGYVVILATITDDVKVEEVWVHVIDLDGLELLNESMSNDGLIDEYLHMGTYPKIGEFNYIIWAKDTSGNWNSVEGGFVIQDTTKPHANAGSNLDLFQGMIVTFNGSHSSDNDRIGNYTWIFNYDGSIITLYGIAPSFMFEKIGKYEITLTVKDPSGNLASDSISVAVASKDSDGDGLTDYDEDNIYGTDPNNPDTDGDDIIDSFEIVRGTDPLVPDKGKEPEDSFLENILWILLIIGVVIIILLLFFLFKRNKGDTILKKEENEEKDSDDENENESSSLENNGVVETLSK